MPDRVDDSTCLAPEQLLANFRSFLVAHPDKGLEEFCGENLASGQPDLLVRLIKEDIRLRQSRDETVPLGVYLRQFPQLRSYAGAENLLESSEANAQQMAAVPRENTTQAAGLPSGLEWKDLAPGTMFLDFEVIGLLGRGSYGHVYLAKELSLGRLVALKGTATLGAEGRALARLNHPNVVRVYREHAIGNQGFLVLQYVRGGTLAEWISHDRKQKDKATRTGYLQWAQQAAHAQAGTMASPSRADDATQNDNQRFTNNAQVAAKVVHQLALALQHAHGHGILHQDIKPANVLVDPQGTPLLTDFNIAVLLDERASFSVGGTLSYMSPEQLRSFCVDASEHQGGVDVRSDIYSLGIVLLELLTGKKTWSDTLKPTRDAAARQLLASRLQSGPPLIAGQDGIDHSLSAIVTHALSPIPQDRYQTAAELATDLARWLNHQSNLHAANPSWIERTRRFVRRNFLPLAGAICLATVLAMVVVSVAVIEMGRVRQSESMLGSAERAVQEKQTARAAEQLGRAKANLTQLSIAPMLLGDRTRLIADRIHECDEQLAMLEASQFAALFGQARLEAIHRSDRTDGSDLIEDSLKAYGVMSDPEWQSNRPFVNLPATSKQHVAENITELLLHSMVTAAAKRQRPQQQWDQVISRLPKEHQTMAIFAMLRSSPIHNVPDPQSVVIVSDFEAYLYGVAATALDNHELASCWYCTAIEQRPAGQASRFWLHYRQGLTLQRLDRPSEALIEYAFCTGMRPDFAWTHFNLGLACYEANQLNIASTHLQHALRLDPEFAAAYLALGALHLSQQDYQAAVAIYDKAIAHGLVSDELQSKRAFASRRLDQQ